MHFATAGIDVSPWIPPAVAFFISFFTSMAGVSGAFLLLPFQMSVLGYVNPSVSATNHLFNVVAIPSGVYRYIKEGRMVWPLSLMVVLGTLPGVFVGAIIRIKYLPNPANFKIFAAAVLFYIGYRMIRGLQSKDNNSALQAENEFQNQVNNFTRMQSECDASGDTIQSTVRVLEFNKTSIRYSFYAQEYTINTIAIFTLSMVVGVVGGIYGIGGGAIIAPFFISFFHLPVYTVAGAALMGTFVTSIAGVLFYQLIAPFYPDISIAPDWGLGFLFGIGGMAGMYAGARCQKFISARYIKWMLAAIILFTAVKYLFESLGN